MKKTYITTMPNHIGAFLKACECFAELGINITRVSYNKAVDSHTLFIDVDGDREKLKIADLRLEQIGYLKTPDYEKSIVLLEFMLEDNPGSVTRVLRIIDRYRLNISYMSSQGNGTGYQAFKMGLFVEDTAKFKEFLGEAGKVCVVRILDYDQSENVYDNSIFYQSFVSELMQCLGLPEELRSKLLVNTNLVMQMLECDSLRDVIAFPKVQNASEPMTECPSVVDTAQLDDLGIAVVKKEEN